MNSLKERLKRARSNPRILLALLAVALLLSGLVALNSRALQETNARKSAESLLFEKTPEDWLEHQHNVAEFRRALDAGKLAAVGLVNAHPGLALYTLHSGARASVMVPGCSALGCAGTVLDKLGDKSAEAGFALVRVDVDPRTGSRRLLDAIESLLAPLLLVGTMVVALFVGMKLQTGIGGAASKLSARPETQFADVIGNDEAKAALNRVKAFMHDPAHYARLGAAAPRGVLLVGPPGTGKTLLARRWPARARPTSSRSTARTSPRCSMARVSPRSRSCSSSPARTRPACCSSTRSTASANAAAAVKAAAPNRS